MDRREAHLAEWDDDYPFLPTLTVDEPALIWTGLYDKDGHEIYRRPEPIGFIRLGEG